jgi:hypothetical protein
MKDFRKLQELYIRETKAFLEGLKHRVSVDYLQIKKDRIKELSRLLDQQSDRSENPSSHPQRGQ